MKERFRPMCGYKVVQHELGVSRLLAWAGTGLKRGGADLALLLSSQPLPFPPNTLCTFLFLLLPIIERSQLCPSLLTFTLPEGCMIGTRVVPYLQIGRKR